jgi:AMP-binding enzyme
VIHSQNSVVLAGEGFVRRMHLQPEERLLCILPMFHVNAIFYSLLGTIAAGATLLLEEKFSASNFWKTVAARKATETNTIAVVMNILIIVETKSGHFNPEKFEDQYEDALKELLKKKQSGEKIEVPKQREPAKVISLMDALRRSVDAERGSGGRGKSERRAAAHRTPKKAARSSARKRAG